MNGRFRTVWLTLCATLVLMNPGITPMSHSGISYAAGNSPPIITPIQQPAATQPTPNDPQPVIVPPREGPFYAVQAAACRHEENARNIMQTLAEKGYEPVLYSWKDPAEEPWHSVFLGVCDTDADAEAIARRYREAEGQAVFVKVLYRYAPPVGEVPATDLPESSSRQPQVTAAPAQGTTAPAARDTNAGEAVEAKTGPEFSCSGFVEFESFVNTEKAGSFKVKNKKNEIRNRLRMRYGTENLYLYSVSNLYLFQTYMNGDANEHYRYAKKQEVSRNLRLSAEETELSFDELYLNYGGKHFRLRAGNQIYAWGTADAFNPTAYFNPSDMREMLFRDDDEEKAGIPSLSGMFFVGDWTLEAVLVPVHVPPIMPVEGDFWSLTIDNSFLPVVFDEPDTLSFGTDHVGYGARLSTSFGSIDMSVSGYHGPDRNLLFIPYEVTFDGFTPVCLRIRPRSFMVTMFGFDLSAVLGDLVVQVEAVYSPDKVGVVEQRTTNLMSVILPFETDRAHYVSYSVGFNYFIPLDSLIEAHTGDTVFTAEWYAAQYLEGGIYTPYITDILSCKFQDSYFDGRLKTTIKGIFDTRHGGKIFWPEIGYDFQNGFLVELGYAAIWGDRGDSWEDDSIFFYFEDSDMVMMKVRYRY